MKRIAAYLISVLILFSYLLIIHNIYEMPQWYINQLLFAKTSYIGGIGGVMYCLRAVYLNRCVFKRWEKEWEVWYYIRPITSTISGFISCIFLKAGLLVLEASNKDSTSYGYLAVAFIAGYNVDNFMNKIESIAQSVWGISKSRASTEESSDSKSEDHNKDQNQKKGS